MEEAIFSKEDIGISCLLFLSKFHSSCSSFVRVPSLSLAGVKITIDFLQPAKLIGVISEGEQ